MVIIAVMLVARCLYADEKTHVAKVILLASMALPQIPQMRTVPCG